MQSLDSCVWCNMKKITYFGKAGKKENIDRNLELYKKYIMYDNVLYPSESAYQEYLIGAAGIKDAWNDVTHKLNNIPNLKVIIAPGMWSIYDLPPGTYSPAVVIGDYTVGVAIDSMEKLNLPVYVGGTFYLRYAVKLKDLKGIPQWCGDGYNLDNCTFESFQGLPDVVERLVVTRCPNIDSLEHFPKVVNKYISILYCRSFKFTKEDILKVCKCPEVNVLDCGVSV